MADSNGGEGCSTPSVLRPDWTAENGRSNSSEKFCELVDEVERLIRGDAHKLLAGRSDMTARLIVAQLAHVHGLHPPHGELVFGDAE